MFQFLNIYIFFNFFFSDLYLQKESQNWLFPLIPKPSKNWSFSWKNWWRIYTYIDGYLFVGFVLFLFFAFCFLFFVFFLKIWELCFYRSEWICALFQNCYLWTSKIAPIAIRGLFLFPITIQHLFRGRVLSVYSFFF